MRTKPQKTHAAPETSSHGFGAKGAHDEVTSLAETLLTGKPLAKAKVERTMPKLKARPKARFGRKDASEKFSRSVDRSANRLVRHGWRFWLVALVALVLGVQAVTGIFNWPSPTLGGRQLWTDIRVKDGWRVQCHAWTGHCRLLDENDVRRVWGDEAQALAALDRHLPDAVAATHAVVLVHGLGRSAHSFDKMARTLEDNNFHVVTFNYASTQGTIMDHAAALTRVLDSLQAERISFVTHSLGAVVVRQALAQNNAWKAQQAPSVLLAGPNQGSQVAKRLTAYVPANWLFGPALAELANLRAVQQLPTPTRFATVSGTNNPLWFFSEKSDGLVSVEETRLLGEVEHLSVQVAHTFIMDDPAVLNFTARFIGG